MKNLALILAILLLALPLAAQWSSDPQTNLLIGDTGSANAIPKIRGTSDNGYWITWFSQENGNYNVRAQHLDSLGVPNWQEPVLISSHPQMSWLTQWDACCDSNDNLIVVFQDIRVSSNPDIFAYSISLNGEFNWGDDGVALTNNDSANMVPMVAATASDNIIVAWQSQPSMGLAKIDSSGNIVYNEMFTPDAGSYSWPQIMPVGQDGFVLKYYQDTGAAWAPTRHLFARRYNSDMTEAWDEPANISTQGRISAQTQILPLAKTPDEQVWISWYDDQDQNNLSSVYVQRVNPDGTMLFDDGGQEVATTAGRQRFYPKITYNTEQERLWVTWKETSAGQTESGLYAQSFENDGAIGFGESGHMLFALSTAGYSPDGLYSVDDDVICIYEQQSGAGSDNALMAIRLDDHGLPVWTVPTAMSGVVVNHTHPDVCYSATQGVIVWEEDRGDVNGIYGQNILADGTIGNAPAQGTLSGVVSLGFDGDVTQVVVLVEETMLNPDNTGAWSIDLVSGDYNVSYTHPSALNYSFDAAVTVTAPNSVSLDDVELAPSGISGVVSLNGGSGDVALVNVSNGELAVNPDEDGNWFMALPHGNYTITFQLEGYQEQAIENTVIDGLAINETDEVVLQVVTDASDINTVAFKPSVYPNPFNPSTTLSFYMPQTGFCQVQVYNLQGRKVKQLHSGNLPAGKHNLTWNGIADSGRPVASGMYLFRLQQANKTTTHKAMLLK